MNCLGGTEGGRERVEGMTNLFWMLKEGSSEYVAFELRYGQEEAAKHSMQRTQQVQRT